MMTPSPRRYAAVNANANAAGGGENGALTPTSSPVTSPGGATRGAPPRSRRRAGANRTTAFLLTAAVLFAYRLTSLFRGGGLPALSSRPQPVTRVARDSEGGGSSPPVRIARQRGREVDVDLALEAAVAALNRDDDEDEYLGAHPSPPSRSSAQQHHPRVTTVTSSSSDDDGGRKSRNSNDRHHPDASSNSVDRRQRSPEVSGTRSGGISAGRDDDEEGDDEMVEATSMDTPDSESLSESKSESKSSSSDDERAEEADEEKDDGAAAAVAISSPPAPPPSTPGRKPTKMVEEESGSASGSVSSDDDEESEAKKDDETAEEAKEKATATTKERAEKTKPKKKKTKVKEVKDPCKQTPAGAYSALSRPNCNAFHEFDMATPKYLKVLAKGGRMMAFRATVPGPPPPTSDEGGGVDGDDDDGPESFVLKTILPKRSISDSTLKANRLDAVLTERLTSSPRAVDLYGYCADSLFTELALTDAMHHLRKEDPVLPEGREEDEPLSSLEKLVVARDAALAVADVHNLTLPGGPPGTYVHRDVRPWNFLISLDGKLKIHDFNAGHYLVRDGEGGVAGAACDWRTTSACNRNRSPEECLKKPMTEKIDVWALGNFLQFILRGVLPYTRDGTTGGVRTLIKKGIASELPERVQRSIERNNDTALSAIRDAMERCYVVDQEERPSAYEIGSMLDKSVDSIVATLAKKGAGRRIP